MRENPFLCIAAALAITGGCAANRCPVENVAEAAKDPENPTGMTVHVLEPGLEPRQVLRYEYAEGETERSRLELVIGSTVEAEGGSAEGLLPPVALDILAGPVERHGDSRIRYRLRVVEAKLAVENVDPEAEAAAEDALAVLKGLDGWVVVDPRGITRDSEFALPADVPRELAVMLGNVRTALMSVPLPEQAVGVGARWETWRAVQVHGMEAVQHVTYTLADVDAHGGMLEVVVHTSAPPQDVGVTHVHAHESSGIGSVNFLLDRLTPLSEADITSQTRAKVPSEVGPTVVQSRSRAAMRLYNLAHETLPPGAPTSPDAVPAPAPPSPPPAESAPAPAPGSI